MAAVQRTTGVAPLAIAALAACNGSGVGLDSNGQPITPGGPPPPLTATFQSIQANVFTPICTRCHIGASAPQGLQLDAAHSYSLLVGVPSAEQPNVLRIRPGDPNNSYLVQKIEGAAGISGVRMPFGGPYLPQSTIDVIRAWVAAGALQSATALANAAPLRHEPFVVEVTAPADGSRVTSATPTIVVAFNHEIDVSLVNYTTVTLSRADAAAAADAVTPVSAVVAAGNPRALLIRPRAPLTPGTYRVTLRGSGGAALADISAQPLGTDYSFTFAVEVSR